MSLAFARFVSGRRTKWAVLALWLVLAAVGGIYGPKLAEVQTNDAASFLPAAAESTQVIQAEAAVSGDESQPAAVVYQRDSGITAADRAAVGADLAAFAEVPGVAGDIVGPIPSEDGQALQVLVPLAAADGFELGDRVDQIRAIATDGAPEGLSANVGGPAAVQGDFVSAFEDLNGTLFAAAALVVIVILLLTYRSPVLWIIPLLSVVFADQLAQAVNYFLVRAGLFEINGQTQSILLVLVFGAGTDYALLLIARYREELRRNEDRHDAMALAVSGAGPAILASAATVIAALLCLLVADLQSIRGLGPASAVGIACALLAATTLLPAAMVAFGRWLFWPVVPKFGSVVREEAGAWARLGGAIARRPRTVWLVTAGVLGLLALNTFNLRADGLPSSDAFKTAPDSLAAQQVIATHYPGGFGSPVVVIGAAESAADLTAVIAADAGIAEVGQPQPLGDSVRIEAVLQAEPETAEALATVERLRGDLDAVDPDALVGGTTALNLDVRNAAVADRNLIIPLILAVVFVILVVLLRSLVAPAMLIGTVVLSYFATLGIMAWLFNDVLGFAGAEPTYPLFAFLFLVALGVDYNIFLMTRVREESQRIGTRAGIIKGLAVTGGVITSAGVVLAATFSVLTVLPLVGPTQIGLTVAVGVLIDALIVRSILVPALGLDLGRRLWWPSALWRREAVAAHIAPGDSRVSTTEPPVASTR